MPATCMHLEDMQQSCAHCSLAHLCLPYELGAEDVSRFEEWVEVSGPLRRGDLLFSQSDPLQAIHVVKMGAVKATVLDAEGLEQIMGFHFPGNLLGLDGLASGQHQCSAVALEDCYFCRIPFARLDGLIDDLSGLRRQFTRLMSQALSDDEQLLFTLGRRSSEGRVAAFLLSLSRRRELRGLPASPVRLSMTRAELANFLGMRIETASRVLGRLKKCGAIAVDRSRVDILDFAELRAWINHEARRTTMMYSPEMGGQSAT